MPRIFPRSLRFFILVCFVGTLFLVINSASRSRSSKRRSPRHQSGKNQKERLQKENENLNELYGDGPAEQSIEDEHVFEPQPHFPQKHSKFRFGIHTYRPDGLLEVNPDGRHPIYDLIERAQVRWKEKLAKQSKTLSEAVKEYKRRYHRPPPKGFDSWWKYVETHNVQLPDEYDRIYRDIEPFWGIKPSDLKKLQQHAESQSDTYTLGFVGGHIVSVNPIISDSEDAKRVGAQRFKEQIALLKDVEHLLPDFRATYTIHDGPLRFVTHDLRWEAIDAAAVNDYIDIDRTRDKYQPGWASACTTSSSLRRVPDPLVTPVVEDLHNARPKTLIYDHQASMNPCDHKEHTWLNGFLANYRIGPGPDAALIPSFSISVTSLHSDILAVAPENWTEDVGDDPEWEDKSDERMLWRGTNTGMLLKGNLPWKLSQRVRMVQQTKQQTGGYSVLRPTPYTSPVGHPENISASILGASLTDVSFTGGPIQCEQRLCDEMRAMFDFAGRQSFSEANQYKYIMDIDGNGWSARFKRLMNTNSLILKSTIFPEWFTDRIMPWVHYVPIKMDLTDLYDVLIFFRGDVTASGEGGHDEMAKKIAQAGKKWSMTFWRKEDMTAYMFRLMLEYGRVMSPDRDSMSFSL